MSSRHLWELTFLRQDTLSINQGCVAWKVWAFRRQGQSIDMLLSPIVGDVGVFGAWAILLRTQSQDISVCAALILSILFKSVFFEFPSFTRLIFLGLLTMAQSCIQSTVMPCTLDLIRWNSKDVCGWIMLGQPQMKKIKWRINQVESAYDNTFDNKQIEARWHFYFSNYSTLIFGSPKLPRCQNREHVYKVNNAKYSYSW